jgi:hypothetical protein
MLHIKSKEVKTVDNQIQVSKHVYFDTECGRYFLTSDALEIVYRKKGLICSYSGASEWIQHFMCEMLDFCSGCSVYNYALGTMKHEEQFPKVFNENKEAVIRFINESLEKPWSKKMYELVDKIIDESEPS